MWFERMAIEVWFDRYQYEVDYDIGESAVKFRSIAELDVDLDLELGEIALRYGHHTGRPDLKATIAGMYPGLATEDVVVTTGAAEAIFALNCAVAKPGDHVIVEHPNYPSLYEGPRSLGCDVELFTLRWEDDFEPDLDRLRAMIRPETRMISLTHPNNPTGSVLGEAALHACVALAEEHDLILLFDETYRELTWGPRPPPAASLSANVVSVSTMSKCYGLPGIRVGWAATRNAELVAQLLTVREQISIANNAVGEEIAYRVLGERERFLERARTQVQANLSRVTGWVERESRVEWVPPQAGVVALPRLRDAVEVEPETLYRTLAEEARTFVLPGRVFEMDPRHFRLGYGAAPEEIAEGLARLSRTLDRLE